MKAYKNSSEDEDYSSDESNISDEEELAALLAIEKEKRLAKKAKAGDDDEEEEEEEEEEEAIYNVDAMHDKLEDIAWTEEQPWAETLAITSEAPTEVADVDDDLERELAFYNQALAAAKSAITKFEEAGVPWQRPADYYADMVKSDDHMARVKEQLLYEQGVIETAEQRRREREAKKFGKQVAAERKKERDHDKKKAITGVSALRKQRQRAGFAGDVDMDAELARLDGKGGRGGRNPKTKLGDRFSAHDKSAKRSKRDAKFGFGGPKRLQKQNDAYSAAGGEYTPSRGGGRGGRGGGRGGRGGDRGGSRGGKAQRPGKSRRASMKTRD